jgi:hypothetical protein
VLALIAVASVARAQDTIFLNEAVVQGAEAVELYNAGPDSVDVGGKYIVGTSVYDIPGTVLVPPGGYVTIPIPGDVLGNIGGEISLTDSAGGGGPYYDRVFYGQAGAAPLPHPGATVSLCRAPDASLDPPLFGEGGYSNATNWTLDLTSTFGGMNDAPVPALGSTIKINEIKPGPPDIVEFYNPTAVVAVNIDITGWFITDGISPEFFLAGIVPSGGVLIQNTLTNIGATQLAYLFTDQGVRVDQLGFLGGPPIEHEDCLMRCPDGAPPHDGFDWLTSGGGTSLFVFPCTLGQLNTENPACQAVPVRTTTWGGLRFLYR